MRVAGIMSGTSLDGIDVAIVDIRRSKVVTVAHRTSPYPARMREAILAVSNCATHTSAISRLGFALAELYANAFHRTCRIGKVPLDSVELIGCHGQTIYHESGRNTLQIGEPAVLAERTAIPVVSNFRARDIAAGGTGAPLVPFVDYLLFRHRSRGRVLLNIGGIANFTSIPAGAGPEDVIAFDTGPGNMVIDALVGEYSDGKLRFDRNGTIASNGVVNRALLENLLRDPYYRAPPPKTVGREQYGAEFIQRLKEGGENLPNLIATATALTAETIATGIRSFAKPSAHDLIVSGGGAHNRTLMRMLRDRLPGVKISTTADFGISVDAKEAIAFAVLAHETYRRRPGNLPGATGASKAVILGSVTR